MLQLKLCQEPPEHCQEQHKKFPEIFFPTFGVVGVVMDFHENIFRVVMLILLRSK
jgi:hypothetical protein